MECPSAAPCERAPRPRELAHVAHWIRLAVRGQARRLPVPRLEAGESVKVWSPQRRHRRPIPDNQGWV